MPNRLKYTPGTTRACKHCKIDFIVANDRQRTGDFCSPHCAQQFNRARLNIAHAKHTTAFPTILTTDASTSPSGGQDNGDPPSVLPEVPLSQPALDRN